MLADLRFGFRRLARSPGFTAVPEPFGVVLLRHHDDLAAHLGVLRPVLRFLLSIPASSASSERLWSSARFLHQSRENIMPQNLVHPTVVHDFLLNESSDGSPDRVLDKLSQQLLPTTVAADAPPMAVKDGVSKAEAEAVLKKLLDAGAKAHARGLRSAYRRHQVIVAPSPADARLGAQQ